MGKAFFARVASGTTRASPEFLAVTQHNPKSHAKSISQPTWQFCHLGVYCPAFVDGFHDSNTMNTDYADVN